MVKTVQKGGILRGSSDTVKTKKVEAPKTAEIRPWLVDPLNSADQLTNCINKHEQSHVLLVLSNYIIDMYSNSVCVYNDASKRSDGKVGVRCNFEPT